MSNSQHSPSPQSTRAPLPEPISKHCTANVPCPCEKHTKDVTQVSEQEVERFTAEAGGNYSYQRAIKGYTTLSDLTFQLVSIVTTTWSLQAHNEDIPRLFVIQNRLQYKMYVISVDSVGLPTLHKLHFLVCLPPLWPGFTGTGEERADLLRCLTSYGHSTKLSVISA